jgi:hypothetical protein
MACAPLQPSLPIEAAMMGRRSEQWSLFYQFRLDERVPKDHLLRRIDRFVTASLADIHERLEPHYSEIGRPSVDPELMIERAARPRRRDVLQSRHVAQTGRNGFLSNREHSSFRSRVWTDAQGTVVPDSEHHEQPSSILRLGVIVGAGREAVRQPIGTGRVDAGVWWTPAGRLRVSDAKPTERSHRTATEGRT